MQQLLKQAYDTNYKDDALILSKASKVVRKDISYSSGFQFNGSFVGNYQQESVPTKLPYLVFMLLNGSSIKDQNSTESQSCLTICQGILFNCTARPSKTSSHHHSRKFEPSLLLYIGLKVHTNSQSTKLVSELSQKGGLGI